MKKLFFFLITLTLTFGIIFNIPGCYPVFLSKDERADSKSEYRTKYFVIKPPQGRWQAVIDTPKFIVPHEGNLLARSMPEIIKFYKIPYVWAIGLEKSVNFSITTYPLFDAEKFNGDTRLIAEAVKGNFELSRKTWWTLKQTKTGEMIKVVTMPKFDSVNIGDKTFYKVSEIMVEDSSTVDPLVGQFYYFTKNRGYKIFMIGHYIDLLKNFEPINYEASKEEALLEEALYLWFFGIAQKLNVNRPIYLFPFLFEYSPEKVTQAFQDVINENPNNYIAHLFFGIHYLTPKEDFYEKVVAPKIKKLGDVERVLTKEMWKFDHYNFNQMWLANKKDFYSYLLHGNFDDKNAITEFEIASKINPDSYTARYFLSWLYLRSGEYEKAVSEYKKILEKYPQGADALMMLAVSYKVMGLEKESEETFNTLKKINHKGTLYDLLDKILGPSLPQSLSEAIEQAVGHTIRSK